VQGLKRLSVVTDWRRVSGLLQQAHLVGASGLARGRKRVANN